MDPSYLPFEQPIAELEAQITELRLVGTDNELNIGQEIQNLQDKSARLTEKIYANLSHLANFPGGPASVAPLHLRLHPVPFYRV